MATLSGLARATCLGASGWAPILLSEASARNAQEGLEVGSRCCCVARAPETVACSVEATTMGGLSSVQSGRGANEGAQAFRLASGGRPAGTARIAPMRPKGAIKGPATEASSGPVQTPSSARGRGRPTPRTSRVGGTAPRRVIAPPSAPIGPVGVVVVGPF